MSIVPRTAPLLVPLLAGRLFAQTPAAAEDPALANLVQEALATNPGLLEAKEAVTAARARPAQARALPDPTLSFNYTNDGWSPTLGEREMANLAVMASQVLTWPGKRRLRGSVSALEADQAALVAERVRLGLVAEVKRAYYGLVLARELTALVHEQEENWKQVEGVARARYAVGQGAQQDVLRVQVEVTRTAQRLAELKAEERVRRAQLNRLRARAADELIETVENLPLVEGPLLPDEVQAAVERASPELGAAAIAIERDRLLVDLAEREGRPDFAVQAGYMNRGRLDPMWQAGVAFNLPVRRGRIQGARTEAAARARASARRLESLRLELRFRTEERLAALEAARTLARLYGDGIVPQDQMSVEAAVANYQAGKVPFVTVLEAVATLYADRAAQLRVLAGQKLTRASLDEGGLEPTSDLPPAGGMSGGGAVLPGGGARAGGGAMTGMGK
jgi:outer membrane protein, heavy metal efflux system